MLLVDFTAEDLRHRLTEKPKSYHPADCNLERTNGASTSGVAVVSLHSGDSHLLIRAISSIRCASSFSRPHS